MVYLEVGKFLYELRENSNYGDKITTKASDFMKNNYFQNFLELNLIQKFFGVCQKFKKIIV